jgi:hypothetical protein
MQKGEDCMTTLNDSANQLARLLLTSLIEIRRTQNTDPEYPTLVDQSDPIGVPGKELRNTQAGQGDVATRPGDEVGLTGECQSEISASDGSSRLQAVPRSLSR